MKISLNWIQEYLENPIDIDPFTLANMISLSLTEVEDVYNFGDKYKDIFVGEIVKLEKHPNADKLTLVEVNDGEGIRSIVCGAPNLEVGQKVPLIKAGSCLPEGKLISRAEIRGIESNGMLCSQKELGLGDNHEGIFILSDLEELDPDKLGNGTPLNVALDLDDVIIEIENKALTHRADCFSHIGIAREIASITGNKFKNFAKNPVLIATEKKEMKVEVKNTKLCPRYILIVIDNVKIEPSPLWLTKRLVSVDMRPINNIVDTTNYVMLDTGQPLHAFDYDKIGDNKEIVVRNAKNGESLTTIDGKSRQVDESMLLITNGKEPLAIAGIMGGIDSEISETTKTIAVESANFEKVNIRKTSATLGLRSEASTRFEKGQCSQVAHDGLMKFIEMVLDTAGGDIVSDLIDLQAGKKEELILEFRLNQIRRKLGIELAKEQIIRILESLGIKILNKEEVPAHDNFASEEYTLELEIPSFRGDLTIEEDILEELARIYGFEKFNPTLPKRDLRAPKTNPDRELRKKITEILASLGMNEIYTYSFIGESLYSKLGLGIENLIQLKNPLSPELEYMRDSLIPSILSKAIANLQHFEDVELFEISRVYVNGEKDKNETYLPKQPYRVGGISCTTDSFNVLKGKVEDLLDRLNVKYSFVNLEREIEPVLPYLSRTQSATIKDVKGEVTLGYIGTVSKKIIITSEIETDVAVFELDIENMKASRELQGDYLPVSKFQATSRDLSIVVSEKLEFASIREQIIALNIKEILSVDYLDTYADKDLKTSEQKSMTIKITLQSEAKTLEEDDIDIIMNKIVDTLATRFEAKVREVGNVDTKE